MHYKITLSFDHDKDGCAWIEEYINVNSLQEAEERIPQIAEDYKITVQALQSVDILPPIWYNNIGLVDDILSNLAGGRKCQFRRPFLCL